MSRLALAVAGLVTGLAAALLPVTVAAPAHAACVDIHEQPSGLLDLDACDDVTPPETAITGVSTPANQAGWVATSTMTFAFTGAHTDTDGDPIALQCKLAGPSQAHDWTACTSPRTYNGLADSAAAGYTFSVRALDAADQAWTYNDPLTLEVDDEPGEDFDASPATVTWGQDTKPPVLFMTPEGYDEETPERPVLRSRKLTLRLNSNEPAARYQCRDNDRLVACTPGKGALTHLTSGDHVVTAQAIDPAGNVSAWSQPRDFTVPRDLPRKKGWKKVTSSGYFDGDALLAKERRTRLVLPRQVVGELRLYAPTAPSYGKLRIQVGRTRWRVVNLAGKRTAMKEFVVIDGFSGTRTGQIRIEVLSQGKPVRIDAIMARRNVFKGD